MGPLNGTNVLVTGGTDGIGAAMVSQLAARGVRTFATGRSASDGARDGPVSWHRVDQADPTASRETLRQLCEGVGADVAILNAGTGSVAGDAGEGAESIRRTLAVNLTATVLIAHALAPMLLERRGTLVLIGSVARKGMAALPSYAASKAGLHGFGRALGEEWRGRATVLTLHPGPTRTAMQGKAGLDVGRAASLFVSAETMAAALLAKVAAAHGSLKPSQSTIAHAAALRERLRARELA